MTEEEQAQQAQQAQAQAQPGPRVDPVTAFALGAAAFAVFLTYRAWVLTTMWNWFGLVFVERPITLPEGVAVAMLLAALRRSPDDDHDKDKDKDLLAGPKRLVKGAIYQAMLVGVGWVVHTVLFS